jgi:enterochelin esterase-like enzyme
LALLLATGAVFGCSHATERMQYHQVKSAAESRVMDHGVYVPPGWDGETPLPLVVFLHGGGDDHRVFDDHSVVTRRLDAWIEAGRLPPCLIVVPNGERGMWVNWHDGTHNYEDYVIDEVIADVSSRYPVMEGREGLHLMGISMGGAGATYLGLAHRDRFASVAIISAPLFDVDAVLRFTNGDRGTRFIPVKRIFGDPTRADVEAKNVFSQVQSTADLRGMRVTLAAGRTDLRGVVHTTEALHETWSRRGVEHRYLSYRGGHGWQSWSRVFPVVLCKHLMGEACELPDDKFYELVEVGGSSPAGPGAATVR